MNLKQMLSEMLKNKGSDLHLRVGIRPYIRANGILRNIETDPISVEGMQAIVSQLLSEAQMQKFQKRNEMDLALSVARLGRFRINLFRQRGTTGVAIRAVNTSIPTFEELHLPDTLSKLAGEHRGLIIITGTTGSGKSTTLAAMLEYMNTNSTRNILTIEDPIEYIFRDKQCIIAQREVGGDTESFASALRHAFRQDPDVILIGEVRDLETMSIALTAADTGHLVLTTLHTLNTMETISRIISFFPPHQHQQIRLLLAGTLKAIVCQRLLTRHDMPGLVPALEIMINTAAIRDCFVDPDKFTNILDLIESGAQYGMQSFDQAIMRLYKRGFISLEEAMNNASNADDFDMRVKGVVGAADRWKQESTPADSPFGASSR
ncbi:MAG: PilT/PilU family type 4a pilus ATPase [candidate division Zixibacteria bacterium]|nr:PilT/PilU family type 4a pilus ATPase [candidate division Zixibacteria bacterium]